MFYFRAWDTVENKMLYEDNIDGHWISEDDVDLNTLIIAFEERYILMRNSFVLGRRDMNPEYSGSSTDKERNLNDIYELDIVIVDEEYFLVLYSNGCFKLMNKNRLEHSNLLLGETYPQIVGNLFETPKLLKKVF